MSLHDDVPEHVTFNLMLGFKVGPYTKESEHTWVPFCVCVYFGLEGGGRKKGEWRRDNGPY